MKPHDDVTWLQFTVVGFLGTLNSNGHMMWQSGRQHLLLFVCHIRRTSYINKRHKNKLAPRGSAPANIREGPLTLHSLRMKPNGRLQLRDSQRLRFWPYRPG